MEAFGEVLGDELPVRRYVGDDALADPELAQAVALEPGVEPADVEGRCVAPREVDEDEAALACHRHRIEREVGELEIRRLHAPRRSDELAG